MDRLSSKRSNANSAYGSRPERSRKRKEQRGVKSWTAELKRLERAEESDHECAQRKSQAILEVEGTIEKCERFFSSERGF